jgi:hypothetical protein
LTTLFLRFNNCSEARASKARVNSDFGVHW